MPVAISVKSDLKRLTDHLSEAERRAVPAATKTALNKAAAAGLTMARRITAREMGIAVKGLKNSFRAEKATKVNLTAAIEATGRPIPLMSFGARQVKAGVSAKPWNKRRIFKGAFVATVGAGHRGAFRRVGPDRLPVKVLWGPAAPKVLAEEAATTATKERVAEVFPRTFDATLSWYLRKPKR